MVATAVWAGATSLAEPMKMNSRSILGTTIQSRTKMQNASPTIHRYLVLQLLNLRLFFIIHIPITSRHLTELWQYCLEGPRLRKQFNIISILIISNKFEKIFVFLLDVLHKNSETSWDTLRECQIVMILPFSWKLQDWDCWNLTQYYNLRVWIIFYGPG